MQEIPKDDWAKSMAKLATDDLPSDHTLGVLWNTDDDYSTFDVKPPDKPATKRGVLSTNASIYEPLGFVSPFVLKCKALFQALCREKSD